MARIQKAFVLSSTGEIEAEHPSNQVRDPFDHISGYGDYLRQPPYSFERLTDLSEAHPIHSAALEQKVTDTIADGFDLSPNTGEDEADEDQRDAILSWWEEQFEEFTPIEVLSAMWTDYVTLGWGFLEVVRDTSGIVRRLYHVPAATIRPHRDGWRFAQIRAGKTVWFKRWSADETLQDITLLASNGKRAPEGTSQEKIATELLVFRQPSRRSEQFGIPGYVSSIGHLVMATAARDFNIKFFENHREPRHLVILTGHDEDVDEASKTLQSVWRDQVVGKPHGTVVLPIQGDANVTIERMADPQNEMQFTAMMEHVDNQVLVAHRVPPDRLGLAKRGFLGGTVANVVNQVYKDGVVSRAQAVLETRLGRFMEMEFARFAGIDPSAVQWRVDFEDLDIADEAADTEVAVALAKSNLVTLNEARARIGMPPHDDFEGRTLADYLVWLGAPSGVAASVGAPYSPTQERDHEEMLRRLGDVDDVITSILRGDDRPAREAVANGNGRHE